MKRRMAAIASFLLMLNGVFPMLPTDGGERILRAQAQDGAADPVSGTWKGDALVGGTQRQALNVTLKYDGTSLSGLVTGPRYPGDVVAGTFDTATGALRFEVVVRDEAKSRVVFEGKIAGEVATGTVMLGGQQGGTFSLARGAAAAAAAAPPPVPSDDATRAVLQKSFADVSGHVMRAAELVPADKYTYRPATSVRTFGQLVAHIADSYAYYCATAGGQTVDWTDAVEKSAADKTALLQKLKQATDACKTTYATGQPGVLVETVAHTNLHYGNMITYLRMLGLVPPSS